MIKITPIHTYTHKMKEYVVFELVQLWDQALRVGDTIEIKGTPFKVVDATMGPGPVRDSIIIEITPSR